MASGWNLWVWLECIGVVIIITFRFSTCISSFLPAASLFLYSLYNYFLVLAFCYFCANVAQRTFEIVQKSRFASNWRASEAREPLSYHVN